MYRLLSCNPFVSHSSSRGCPQLSNQRFLHPTVEFTDRQAEQLRCLGLGNGSLDKGVEREPLEMPGIIPSPEA